MSTPERDTSPHHDSAGTAPGGKAAPTTTDTGNTAPHLYTCYNDLLFLFFAFRSSMMNCAARSAHHTVGGGHEIPLVNTSSHTSFL